jgi:formylglycine-generating enzyme required for sulfatase activity/dienelactone hydrolase
VHGLVEDIERHLKNEPILARAPSLVYLAQKFWQRRRPHIASTAGVTVLLAGFVVIALMYQQTSNLQWAKGEALPRMVELVKDGDYIAAFTLAQKVKEFIPEDPILMELWPRISKDYSITTTPAGASIFYKEYSAKDEPWQYLGQSPLESIALPKCRYRWKVEKDGFETHKCVVDDSFEVKLRKEGFAREMVWISAWAVMIHTDSSDQGIMIEAPAYLIDKYEVTNEQFKEFVDSGGYQNQEYWVESHFLKERPKISWEEAMIEFVDKTGLPGPATWKNGTYLEGKGKHPVSGVSWFEADAYARFVGKSLPTLYHWEHAACLEESIFIVPYSRFAVGGATAVGSNPGMGHTGLYDMAGNIKEWCWNAVDDPNGPRYILGGGWGEQTYMFTMRDFRSPWDRTPVNGFRCVEYVGGEESVADVIFDPVPRPLEKRARDYSKMEPCSDEEYGIILQQFEYDQTPLNPMIESIDENSSFWLRREKITFDAAYGGERVIAYLFIPKDVEPPYQTVVYWPGCNAPETHSFQILPERDFTEFIITSGRALLFPIYKGTFERHFEEPPDIWLVPQMFTDWVIQLDKDLRRSVDYLETRKDIDSDRIAYYGMDSGAAFGPMALAMESRFKTAVLVVGGFPTWDIMEQVPAIDPLNHAPRVKTPILMINGRDDYSFPLESSQRPMYETLGTPELHKEHRVYSGGHGVLSLFSKQVKDDVLGWLDRYLGPVNKKKDITK